MDIRVRTALISTGLNLALTTFKFILFVITGSLAILAETWHSFADVGTSIVVLIAVRRGLPPGTPGTKDDGIERHDATSEADSPAPSKKTPSLNELALRANAEHYAAFGIGLFLSLVAVGLLYKVILYQRQAIERPLLSGVLFLCFAVGSYFVFRFETAVGEEHGSVGLISDGLHSKADMMGALLTGAAMILYSLGVDLDRPVAVVISLFVLSFGVETLINTAVAVARPQSRAVGDLRTVTILLALFDKEKIKQAVLWFEESTSIKALDRLRTCRSALRLLRWPTFVVLALTYLSTCFFIVNPTDEAIVERLGKPLNRDLAIGPGLHLKAPWPIDRVIKIDVQSVRQLALGNVSAPSSFALIWTQEHGTGAPFLSGDNNFFFPYLIIHYRVSNVFDFVMQHANPEDLLDGVAHGRVSTLFASLPFEDIVGKGRGDIEHRIGDEVQDALDELACGIEILGVHIKDVHPPISIAGAFERVIAARQEKQEMINTAYGYRNQRLPEARGEAERKMAGAYAYVEKRVRHAEGDAQRFLARRVSEPQARAITERRLHLEAIAEAIQKTNSILVDPDAGIPTLLLEGKMVPGSEAPMFLVGEDRDEETQ